MSEERDVVAGDFESGRCELLRNVWASGHIEEPIAPLAEKVVVVLVGGPKIAKTNRKSHLHCLNFFFYNFTFD